MLEYIISASKKRNSQRSWGAAPENRINRRSEIEKGRNRKNVFFKDGVECLTVMIMLTSFDSLKTDLVFLLGITGCFVVFWVLSMRARRRTDVDRPAKQWWFFVAALIGSGVFLACRVRWWLGLVPLLPLVLFSLLLRSRANDILSREQQRDSK